MFIFEKLLCLYIIFRIFLFPLILKPIPLSINNAPFSCFWFEILIPPFPKTQALGFVASFSETLSWQRGVRKCWGFLPTFSTNPGYVYFAAIGAVPSPFDCYLCNRGLKTLQVRMQKHFENGMAVAQFLESHPLVEKVIYPGMLIWVLSTYSWDCKA